MIPRYSVPSWRRGAPIENHACNQGTVPDSIRARISSVMACNGSVFDGVVLILRVTVLRAVWGIGSVLSPRVNEHPGRRQPLPFPVAVREENRQADPIR